jgi:hypothetical protein
MTRPPSTHTHTLPLTRAIADVLSQTNLFTHFWSLTFLADEFGNNRTSSNLDANILLLGRLVTSPAGPYPETAGSSLAVSAFQSVTLADSVNSGFYLGRYIMQRTALRPNQGTYLRASIGE